MAMSACSFLPTLSRGHGCHKISSSKTLPPPPSPHFSSTRSQCSKKSRAGKRVSPSLPVPRALQDSKAEEEKDKDNEELSLVTALRSEYNEIVIVDTPKSRLLLLDSTHNIHSIYNKDEKWTGSYWDEFASLPAIIPPGPIAILGLAGGTAAHLLLELWPSLTLEGWEIDGILVDKAREFFGLSDLEKGNRDGGVLHVHVGDAFSPSAVVPGGFAGIVVDLFSNGKVLPQLQEVETWLELGKRLMPNGRIMVNCGGAHDAMLSTSEGSVFPNNAWVHNSTVEALCKAFPGNLSWKKLTETEGENYLVLTGPIPDLNMWATLLPDRFSSNLGLWRPCNLHKDNPVLMKDV